MSRRGEIAMTAAEAAAFPEEPRTVTCAASARYGGADLTPELGAAMRAQVAERVGLQFLARRRVSWDHRKLGGTD